MRRFERIVTWKIGVKLVMVLLLVNIDTFDLTLQLYSDLHLSVARLGQLADLAFLLIHLLFIIDLHLTLVYFI